MTEPEPTNATADLVAVEPDLATHVMDLLDAAGIEARGTADDAGLIMVAVPAPLLLRARATLDLVLPGLLAEESGELLPDDRPARLSGRLIRRSDWTSEGSAEAPVDQAEPDESGPHQSESDAPRRQGLLDGRSAFAEALDAGPAAEDDGDFIPQEPPPIPRGDIVSRFAWLGAVGGPVLLVLTALLDLPGVLAGVGVAAFVVGFGVLVARMPDRPRQDDGWDDGAVL